MNQEQVIKTRLRFGWTSSWHRAIGIRWWSYEKDWKLEFSFWWFDISIDHDETNLPF